MSEAQIKCHDPYCSFEGMCWPKPGERLTVIERICRGYGAAGHDTPLTVGDRMVIASVISAYNTLVLGPTRGRAHKLFMIRQATQIEK